MKIIRIKQIRSRIGQPKKQKKTLEALGLRKINQIVEHNATSSILGMIKKVKHLVKIEIVTPIVNNKSTNFIGNQQNQKCLYNLLDLKIQLTNEYLKNGGMDKINDENLLEDLINFNLYDKSTYTPRLNVFMNIILHKNCMPPPVQIDALDKYDSFIQKELFFDQIKIDNEEQIDQLINKYQYSKDFIFRGQREAFWRLYNTIQRGWIEGKYEGKLDFTTVLKKMIEIGIQKHKSDIVKIIEKEHIDVLNDLAVLGFIQHHGCPSPLLDWTSSFINALFFAIDGFQPNTMRKEIENYISVYFLNNKDIESSGFANVIDDALKTIGEDNKANLIAMNAKDEKQIIEKEKYFKDRDIFDRKKIEGSGLIRDFCKIENIISCPHEISYLHENNLAEGIVFSLLNSQNIKKQQGVFIWNSSSYKPLEVIASENFEAYERKNKTESYKFCDCYNINKKLIPYIQEKLQGLGITKEATYPDEGINTKYIFDIAQKSMTN